MSKKSSPKKIDTNALFKTVRGRSTIPANRIMKDAEGRKEKRGDFRDMKYKNNHEFN